MSEVVRLLTIPSLDQFQTQAYRKCGDSMERTFKVRIAPLARHGNDCPPRCRYFAASLAVVALVLFQTHPANLAAAPPQSAPVKDRSLEPPVFLPDGSEFRTWEPEEFRFSRTLYVSQHHQNASDANPGTEVMPLKSIGRAAELLQPGERVVVGSGVYREWVCPPRGGTDSDHMISYELRLGPMLSSRVQRFCRQKWKNRSRGFLIRGREQRLRLPRQRSG